MLKVISKKFDSFSSFKRNHSIIVVASQIVVCVFLAFLIQSLMDIIANSLIDRPLSYCIGIFSFAVFCITVLFYICFPRCEFSAIWRKLPDMWVRVFAVTTLALVPISAGILADHAMRIFDWYTFQTTTNSPPTIAFYTVYYMAIVFVILSTALYSFREKFLKISANIEAEVHNKPYDILIIALSPLSKFKQNDDARSEQQEAKARNSFIMEEFQKLSDDIDKCKEKMELIKRQKSMGRGIGLVSDKEAKLEEDDQAILLGVCCEAKEKGGILSSVWQQPIRVIRHFINNRKKVLTERNKPYLEKLQIIVFATNETKVWYDNFVKLLNELLKIDTIELYLAPTLEEGKFNETVKKLKDTIENYSDKFSMGLSHKLGKNKRIEPRICIDITSGIKEWSVAAAAVTINKSLNFCYMNNQTGEDPNAILYYDAHISGSELGI